MTASMLDQLVKVSLYEKLGASAGIRKLVDEIVDAQVRNPVIKARFQPSLQRQGGLAEIKRQTCLFFSGRIGGPDACPDRSMINALRAMRISNAEYMAALDDITATMARHGYDQATRSEVLAVLTFLKADIVAP